MKKTIFFCTCFVISFTVTIILQKTIPEYRANKEFIKYQTQYPKLTRRIYDKVILESEKNKVDKKIIFAIMKSESDFNQFAISSTNALGLMQILPGYHLSKELQKHPACLYDIDLNVEIGVKYFSELMQKNKGNLIRSINDYERGKRQDINVNYMADIFDNINKEM